MQETCKLPSSENCRTWKPSALSFPLKISFTAVPPHPSAEKWIWGFLDKSQAEALRQNYGAVLMSDLSMCSFIATAPSTGRVEASQQNVRRRDEDSWDRMWTVCAMFGYRLPWSFPSTFSVLISLYCKIWRNKSNKSRKTKDRHFGECRKQERSAKKTESQEKKDASMKVITPFFFPCSYLICSSAFLCLLKTKVWLFWSFTFLLLLALNFLVKIKKIHIHAYRKSLRQNRFAIYHIVHESLAFHK